MASGGSFIKRGDKEPELVQATADHPEGNCARHADGKQVDARAEAETELKKQADKLGDKS